MTPVNLNQLLFRLANSTLPLTAINPLPNKPWFLSVSSTSLLKTLWEKEKLLRAISDFSHNFFYLFRQFSAFS